MEEGFGGCACLKTGFWPTQGSNSVCLGLCPGILILNKHLADTDAGDQVPNLGDKGVNKWSFMSLWLWLLLFSGAGAKSQGWSMRRGKVKGKMAPQLGRTMGVTFKVGFKKPTVSILPFESPYVSGPERHS